MERERGNPKGEQERELARAQEALQKSFNYLASTFGIGDPAGEFQIVDYMNDDLGMRHFRLQQIYNGLPVFGQHLIVHITKEGEVRDHTGDYRRVTVGTEARKTASEAIEIARQDFGTENRDEFNAQLIIYPVAGGEENRLAYQVTMPLWQENVPLRLRYFIDAHSGEILDRFNDQTLTGDATTTHGIARKLSGQ